MRAHGTGWRRVWALTGEAPALAARIDPALPYVGAEFVHAVRYEQACTLTDLLVRRAPVAYETRDAGRAAARRVAALVAGELGWTPDAIDRALAAHDAESARLFGIDP